MEDRYSEFRGGTLIKPSHLEQKPGNGLLPIEKTHPIPLFYQG